MTICFVFFFQAEDGIRDHCVTGVQTCALPILADGAELRVHPTGKAVLRISVQTQGQGHETTFAQIVAEELGISPDDIEVVHGDTDQTPFGLGTYGSRSTPVSGAATAVVARKVRERAKIVAAAMLEA